MVETPIRRKCKIVTQLTIQDESLWSCGDFKEYFKFDILSDCKVPVLEVMAILMIHHMVVEVFLGGLMGECSVGIGSLWWRVG